MSLTPGARFDAYEILHLLGAGGMGEVYLAKEVRLGRVVALKLLPDEVVNDPKRVARFEQEARSASGLSHPNVCTIYALGETSDGQRYIAMEFVEGQTLRHRLAADRVALRQALDIAIQIASGISAAHALGVVHRDLKPENVLVRTDGLVKIVDFGLAKLAPAGRMAPETAGTTRLAVKTDPGGVVGTVSYMSPEQARGQEVDARTDVWSLGVILYELIAGRVPFGGRSSSDVLVGILEREPAPVTRFEPDASAELQRIVVKALRKDREQRYQNARDLLLDLQALRDTEPVRGTGAVAGAIGPTPTPAGASPTPSSMSSAEYLVTQAIRHKLLAATVGTLILTMLAGVVWWTGFGRRDVSPSTPPREPGQTRLTANPTDLPLSSASISPDGRHLAYADPTGIKIRFIDSGEAQPVPDSRGMRVYGWSGDSTKVRASACEAGTCVGWDVSLVGGARRRTGASWLENEYVKASPDGSRLLRLGLAEETSQGGDLTLDLLNGTPPRRLASSVGAAGWSADGNRILFAKQNGSAIERIPLEGGPSVTVFNAEKGQEVVDILELRTGRLIVGLLRRPMNSVWFGPEISLWEVRTDSTGIANESPRRLTDWQEQLEFLSASADGAQLAYLSTATLMDVYVAGFDLRKGLTDAPRRLTMDDRYDVPMDWTPDSTAVLFHSTRNGNSDIFKQRIDGEVAEPLVVEPGDQSTPRVTSDGRWVLFDQLNGPDSIHIMRVPLSGGTPQRLREVRRGSPFCSAHGRCVVYELRDSGVVISSIDPITGSGTELARVSSNIACFNLLPDGEAFAYVPSDTGPRNRVHVVSFKGEPPKDIIVPRATNLSSLSWLPSGAGFFTTDVTPSRSDVLFISPDGTPRSLWSPTQLSVYWAIPSPNGKHLAMLVMARQSNAWMLTDF
jgi:eukaryotic-like serine/threonine-protein kinase